MRNACVSKSTGLLFVGSVLNTVGTIGVIMGRSGPANHRHASGKEVRDPVRWTIAFVVEEYNAVCPRLFQSNEQLVQ
jgi:hypothetical protein